MPDAGPFRDLVLLELALAVPTFVALRFLTAPYGRHAREGWGPRVPAWLGWIAMESPAVLVFLGVFAAGAHRGDPAPLALLALWQLHYVHRAFLYPLRLRGRAGDMPAVVVAMGAAFNVLNAFVNARWISHLGGYPGRWLADPRFLGGAALFLAGLALNLASDRRLRRLRAPGERGYRVPRGGAFEWVSCPNYLGEIVEWCGWAIASWSLAGLAFAVFTAANLGPRALSHHAWYRSTFPDYPPARRALLPYLL
jgi:3-oxo-5-alpha-steroid 4-dehydrogenase 1